MANRLDAQDHRDRRYSLPKAGRGWHLSWMGSEQEREQKLHSFSHAELVGKLDVAAAAREGIHANGEVMQRIDPADLDWPAPMFDTFDPPDTWRAPVMQEV